MRIRSMSPLLLGVALLAGCGSSSKSSPSGSTAAPPASAGRASSASASAAPATPIVISTKHAGKLGTVLAAGQKRLTVYLFTADGAGRSSCSGACTRAWPPVIGAPRAGRKIVKGDLGTIALPGGGTQVTYKGHPLYFFVKDKDDGDAYGEAIKNFGGSWYALRASGSMVDNT